MSKAVIKAREEQAKKYVEQQAAKSKFLAKDEVSASDARKAAEAANCPSIDDMVTKAWTTIMAKVKQEAASGASYMHINAGPIHDPEVKAQVIKKLEKAGFRHEMIGVQGYIYW